MEAQNCKKQDTAQDIFTYAFKLLTVQKKSSDEVRNLLIEKGLDETKAGYLVADIEQRLRTEQKKAREDMEMGGWVFGIGVVITGLTYLISDYTNLFIVTWGFIFYGAFLLLRGFSNWQS